MDECRHKSLLDIVEDPITHVFHFVCGECETDFGDAIEYINELHDEIRELKRENIRLKHIVNDCD